VTVYSQAGSTPDLTWSQPPVTATLFSMAAGIRAVIEQAAAGRGLVLPKRQVTYLMPIPADCEQVAVVFGGWLPEPPWQGLQVCQTFRWLGRFGVMVTRKTPAIPAGSSAPPVEWMEKAAMIASEDAEMLLEVVSSLGEVYSDLVVETPAPEGGYQTTALTVTLPAFGAA
jgi:hypothetical protein